MAKYKGYDVISVREFYSKGKVPIPSFQSKDYHLDLLHDEAMAGNVFLTTRRQTRIDENNKQLVRESLLLKVPQQ